MDIALLLARFLLAAVFVVAGVAKLADRAGSRQAIINFGVPAALATPLGILLPLAELAVAVALIPIATAWWGAVGALALLLLFVAGISINVARGRTPDCHCFGQLYSAPAGWSTLVRNAVLATIAGFVVWQGQDNVGPSAVSWLGRLAPAYIIGLMGALIVLGLLIAEGVLLVNLLAQNGRLLVRIEALEARFPNGDGSPIADEVPATPAPGLPVGSQAPTFGLRDVHGEMFSLDVLRARGTPVMLIASDSGCGPCTALLPEIGRWQRDYAPTLTIALISRGSPEANRAKSAEHGLRHVLLQQDREVHQAYQVAGTPSAVLVREDGTIGSPPAAGAEQIRSLVVRTVGAAAQGPILTAPAPPATANKSNGHRTGTAPVALVAARLGDFAPTIALPDLTGTTVELAAFRGNKTLVLFWNPGCGFCQRMLPELQAWEATPPKSAPKLLVVSTGTVDATRMLGLESPVVLDQGFTTGTAFGATGTPSAVLVDEQGRVASQLAVGASAVMVLACGEQNQVDRAG